MLRFRVCGLNPVKLFKRYLALLMKGGKQRARPDPPFDLLADSMKNDLGVYTDTDTACVRRLFDWPGIRENHWEITTKTDPVLSFLPNVYDMLSVASKQYTQHGSDADPVRDVRKRMVELEAFEPPKLVVALEYDHWTPGSQDWRELGFSRGMQFVQVNFVSFRKLES